MSSANELEDEKVGALLTMYVAVKGGGRGGAAHSTRETSGMSSLDSV